MRDRQQRRPEVRADVVVQKVEAELQLGARTGPPQQAAGDVGRARTHPVDMAVGAVAAEVEPVPERVAQRTVHSHRCLIRIEASVRQQGVPLRGRRRRRLLRDGVDGAGHRALPVEDRRRPAQHLHPVEVEGVLRPHDHVGRTEPDPVAQHGDLRPREAAHREARRRGGVLSDDDARRGFDRVADPLIAPRFHDRAVDDVERRRYVHGAQAQAAARVRFFGQRQFALNPGNYDLFLEFRRRETQIETDRQPGGHGDAGRERRESLASHRQRVVTGRDLVDDERPVRPRGRRDPELLKSNNGSRQCAAAAVVHHRSLHGAECLSVRRPGI